MINYKNLQEVSSPEKHHVLAFGRMNPITSGHEAVVNKLHSVAKEHGASHSLVVSHSQDAKKNPLTGEQKVAHAKNAFPGTRVSSASKEAPTILHHAAAAHAAGATHLHVIAGSDRHEEMHNLLHKYNGNDSAHGHYNFKKITVHSSGERDPDAEGTSGISASKMRDHATSGNKVEFHKGAPSKMKPEHKDAMYNDVRKGMNIKEDVYTSEYKIKTWVDPVTGETKTRKIRPTRIEFKNSTMGAAPAQKTVDETLRPEMGAGVYINDFMRSTNPKFNNKTPQERRVMAMGAYMAARARGVKEEIELEENTVTTRDGDKVKVGDAIGYKDGYEQYGAVHKIVGDTVHIKSYDSNTGDHYIHQKHKSQIWKEEYSVDGVRIDELSTDLLGKYKTAAGADAKSADAAGNYAKGNKRFSGIIKATNKQFDNDLKKPAQMKEDNSHYEDAKEHMTLASKALETSDMISHHGHMADHHDSLSQWHDSKGRSASAQKHADKAEEHADQYTKLARGVSEGAQSGQTKGFKFFKGENDKQMNTNQPVKEQAPVAPTLDRKYIKGTPEHKAYKALRKPINGHPTNVKEETLDELSPQRNAHEYNLAAAQREMDSRHAQGEDMSGATIDKKTYKIVKPKPHGVTEGENRDGVPFDGPYKSTFKKPNNPNRTGMDSARSLAQRAMDRVNKKKSTNEATIQKSVNVDKVNAAGQEPHEEKFETVKKPVTKLKTVKEGTMKTYREFVENYLLEYTPGPDGVTVIKGRSYGADYADPDGADETAADMKKKEKKSAGRKAGQSTGSYKPRKTMSALKRAGAVYK